MKICPCCGRLIKEKKKSERPVQENIIAKWLKSNEIIQWEYRNDYYKSVAWQYPLTSASAEIKIDNFYIKIYCRVDSKNNIGGRIIIRIIVNNKKKTIDTISLDGLNDITTEKIIDMIRNRLMTYKNIICETCIVI